MEEPNDPNKNDCRKMSDRKECGTGWLGYHYHGGGLFALALARWGVVYCIFFPFVSTKIKKDVSLDSDSFTLAVCHVTPEQVRWSQPAPTCWLTAVFGNRCVCHVCASWRILIHAPFRGMKK